MKVALDRITISSEHYLGKSLAGYSRKEKCSGKLDDIHAYGVLITQDDNKGKIDCLLMISVDILKLPLSIVEYIKKKLIQNFTLLNSDYILIHATHSHASFDLTGEFYYQGGALAFMKGVMFADNKNDKYIVWMTNRIIELTKKLFKQLQPCIYSWKKKKFNPGIVINRRWPRRETLPDLGIISFKSIKDNNIIGLIINYACHPTTLSYKNNKLSADYPGRIIEKVRTLTSDKVKAMYINGPSGDLNPITTSGTDFEQIERDKTLTYDQLGTYKDTIKIGSIIAQEALELENSIPKEKYCTNLEINFYKKEIFIPKKDAKYFSKVWFSNKLKWIIKKYFLMKVAKFDKKSVNFPFFTEEHKGFRRYSKTYVNFINLKSDEDKNLGIITIPGELFEGIGKNLIRSSPTGEENTFIFQNSQDWIGYLFPLETYINEGGYEPFMCYSPLCGLYIETETITLLKSTKD